MDEERQAAPAGGGWFCAWVLVNTTNGAHHDVRGGPRGRRLTQLHGVCMHTEWTSGHIHTCTSIERGPRTRTSMSPRFLTLRGAGPPGFAWLSSSRNKSEGSTAPFFVVEIAAVCSISYLRGSEVGALNGGVKCEGETDEEADVTECEGSAS